MVVKSLLSSLDISLSNVGHFTLTKAVVEVLDFIGKVALVWTEASVLTYSFIAS